MGYIEDRTASIREDCEKTIQRLENQVTAIHGDMTERFDVGRTFYQEHFRMDINATRDIDEELKLWFNAEPHPAGAVNIRVTWNGGLGCSVLTATVE